MWAKAVNLNQMRAFPISVAAARAPRGPTAITSTQAISPTQVFDYFSL
jgi:hypothetical protein